MTKPLHLTEGPNEAGALVSEFCGGHKKLTPPNIAQRLGWSLGAARRLVTKGSCRPIDLAAVAPRLVAMGLADRRLCDAIAHACAPVSWPIGQAIVRRMAADGLSTVETSRRLEMAARSLDAWISGSRTTNVNGSAIKRLAAWIGVPHETLREAALRQSRRNVLPTSQVRPGQPISELILAACDRENLGPTTWSLKHKIRDLVVRQLVHGEQPHITTNNRTGLMDALDLDEDSFLHAYRRNRIPPSGVAVHIQKILKERLAEPGMHITKLEKILDIHSQTLASVLRTGDVSAIQPLSIYRLRKALSMSLEDFNRGFRAEVAGTKVAGRRKTLLTGAMDDPGEIALIKLWRKASADARKAVAETLWAGTSADSCEDALVLLYRKTDANSKRAAMELLGDSL